MKQAEVWKTTGDKVIQDVSIKVDIN